MKKISGDKFDSEYEPLKNPYEKDMAFDNCMLETYQMNEEEPEAYMLKAHSEKRLWTIVEIDGNMYAYNELSFVNRFGYLVTKKAYSDDDDIEVLLWDENEMNQ